MAQVTQGGTPVHTIGDLPRVGDTAPDFLLTKGDLSDVSLADFAGKKKILNVTVSLDTGTCAASARRFNTEAASLSDTVVLTVSGDLPFAQTRFCEAEGLENAVTLSQLRNRDFGRKYGLELIDGPTAGLCARAVIILDEDNTVTYVQLVPEISNEPDYESVLEAIK